MKKHLVGTLLGAALALVAACAGDSPTAPDESHPAIPQLAKSESNCAVWSCSSGQCAKDPAIYGACCTQVTDIGEPGVPKPANCDAPPGGGGRPDYCDNASLQQACLDKAAATPGWYANCYATPYSYGNTGEAIFGNTGDVFSECQQ